MGVRDHFPICGTRMPSHALVIDMALAIGAEIPAPSEVLMFALANTSSYEQGGDGDFSSTAGPQA